MNRDLFWKGSFAKDSLIGFEERVARRWPDAGNAATFARGAFWKRFDSVKDGVATGLVVNYDLDALPGLPEVRAVDYPDDNRRYFSKGDQDPAAELHQRSLQGGLRHHQGDRREQCDRRDARWASFRTVVEFATFVMARYSYPLERMSIDDYSMIVEKAWVACSG